MRLFHITLWKAEKQEELIPRIPDKTSIDEDICTARISMAPTIKNCIRGIGDTDIWKYENRIRVYTLNVEKEDEYLIGWKDLYESGKVYDAPIVHEYWYRKTIIPKEYSEYRVFDIETEKYIIVKHTERNRVINAIMSSGIKMSTDILGKTAIEIVNKYKNHVNLEDIKRSLSHTCECENVDREIYRKLYNQDPPIEIVPEYSEAKYIKSCRIEKI